MRRYLASLLLMSALVACGQPLRPAVNLPLLPDYPNIIVVENNESKETINGRIVQHTRRQNMMTADTQSEVVEWYSAELPKLGWTLSAPQMTVLESKPAVELSRSQVIHAERPGCPIIYIDVVVTPENEFMNRVAIEEGAKPCP